MVTRSRTLFIGVFFGLATGCLIAGWMMLGLAIGWHLKKIANTQILSPRVIRARHMLAAARHNSTRRPTSATSSLS